MTCIGGLLNTVTGSVILTADEVKEVEGHIDQLNAENARLRSCLSDDAENAKLIMAENAKLRELASILCFCMQVHAQCDDCKLNGAKGELAHDPLCACDGLHEILRELGIEVDE